MRYRSIGLLALVALVAAVAVFAGPDGGGEWTTEGHSGINIQNDQIPKPGEGGEFDPTSVASLAVQLIHELSHLTDPNNAANSEGEYESPAYKHSAEQMCKVADCEQASAEDKEVACEYVRTANQKLCEYGEDQVACPACPNSQVDCPPPIGGGFTIQPDAPDIPSESHYFGGGVVELYPLRNDLEFRISGVAFSLDLDAYPLDFRATSFARLEGERLIVGGWDTVAQEGEFVEVVFDPAAGSILSVSTIFQGADFEQPNSMVRYAFGPSAEVVFFIEAHSHDVKVLVPWIPTCALMTSSATEPRLLDCRSLNAQRFGSGNGFILMASSSDQEGLNAPLAIQNLVMVDLIDVDGNGSIDFIQ